jgi:hypothetical protein
MRWTPLLVMLDLRVLAVTDKNMDAPGIQMDRITSFWGNPGNAPKDIDYTIQSIAAHEFGHADYLYTLYKANLAAEIIGEGSIPFSDRRSNARALDFSNAYRATNNMQREDWHTFQYYSPTEQSAR